MDNNNTNTTENTTEETTNDCRRSFLPQSLAEYVVAGLAITTIVAGVYNYINAED